MKTKTKFKETEIGKIPEDWEVTKAEDFCEKVTDGTHDSPKKKETGKYLVTSKHLKNNSLDFNNAYLISEEDFIEVNKRSVVNQFDILFSMIGTVGETYQERSDKIDYAIKNVGLFKFGGNEDKSNWFFYWVKSIPAKYYTESRQAGSTQQYLTLEALRKFPIAIPTNIKEQTSISKILSDLDSKIKLFQKQNENLEKIGQALFKHWFIDFEFPNEKGKPYKSSGGKMVDSELGKIPEEWEIKKLIEIVTQLKPGTNYQPKRVESGIPFVNVKNIRDGFLNLNDVKYITQEEFERVHKYWVPEEHDVLITRIGTLGNVAVIRKSDLPVAIHYNSIDIKAKLTSFQFLYFLFNTNGFQRNYHVNKKQSVQEYVTIDEVEKIKIILPKNISDLRKYEQIFIDLFNKIEINSNNIENLSQIRDKLLPKLMSGKIRVLIEVRK